MINTCLCYIEKDGKYLMLHRVKKENDLNHDKWVGLVTFVSNQWGTEYMHLFHSNSFEGDLKECDEGNLEWVEKSMVYELPLWAGDKIFLKLLEKDIPFFSLKLVYEGEKLINAVLNRENLNLGEV